MKQTTFRLIVMLTLGLLATPCLAAEITDVDIHGFISQGYLNTSNNYFYGDTVDGSFEFNEFGINFSENLTDRAYEVVKGYPVPPRHVRVQISMRLSGDN